MKVRLVHLTLYRYEGRFSSSASANGVKSAISRIPCSPAVASQDVVVYGSPARPHCVRLFRYLKVKRETKPSTNQKHQLPLTEVP